MRPFFFSLPFERFAACAVLSLPRSPSPLLLSTSTRKNDRRRYSTQRTVRIRQATPPPDMAHAQWDAAEEIGSGARRAEGWQREIKCRSMGQTAQWDMDSDGMGMTSRSGGIDPTVAHSTPLAALLSLFSVSGAVGMFDHWTPSGSHRLHCRWQAQEIFHEIFLVRTPLLGASRTAATCLRSFSRSLAISISLSLFSDPAQREEFP